MKIRVKIALFLSLMSTEISRKIIDSHENMYHKCRDVSTSKNPVSIRKRHLQTFHVGGAAVNESCKRTPSSSPCSSYIFSNSSIMFANVFLLNSMKSNWDS